MHRGYIKLWRRIQDNPLWVDEKFTRAQAWIDLILLANHRDGHIRVRGIKVPICRGQCGWSILSLASRWQWSRGKVVRFLDELETVQQIEQQKNRLTTLINIINYEDYQSDGTTDRTTDRTTDGQQTDTNKNDKNEKNKRLDSPVCKKGRNGKRKLPDDFCITDEMSEWFAKQNFQHITIEGETCKWVDYWISRGDMRADWTATWRNGMRLAEKWAQKDSGIDTSWMLEDKKFL